MAAYSVAEAKKSLPALIENTEAGEHVVITRHGHPVVELRPLAAVKTRSVSSYAWLKQKRAARKPIGMTSVELLNEVDEDER
jgi:prevent-host-death family protein